MLSLAFSKFSISRFKFSVEKMPFMNIVNCRIPLNIKEDSNDKNHKVWYLVEHSSNPILQFLQAIMMFKSTHSMESYFRFKNTGPLNNDYYLILAMTI